MLTSRRGKPAVTAADVPVEPALVPAVAGAPLESAIADAAELPSEEAANAGETSARNADGGAAPEDATDMPPAKAEEGITRTSG